MMQSADEYVVILYIFFWVVRIRGCFRRGRQPLLAGESDFGDQQMTAVAAKIGAARHYACHDALTWRGADASRSAIGAPRCGSHRRRRYDRSRP